MLHDDTQVTVNTQVETAARNTHCAAHAEQIVKQRAYFNMVRDEIFLRNVRAAAAAARPAEIAQRVAAAAAAEWQAEQAEQADADFLAMVRERIAAARPHMIAQRAAYDYARTVAVETRRAVARRAA